MENRENKRPVRSRVKRNSSLFVYLIPLLIIAFLLAIYLYNKSKSSDTFFQTEKKQTTLTAPPPKQILPLHQKESTSSGKQTTDSLTTQITTEDHTVENEKTEKESTKIEGITTEEETPKIKGLPVTKADNPDKSGLLIKRINDFYSHLDKQPYIKTFKLKEPSKEHFSRLVQKLIDHPPVVTRETDDLFTILKNTAHFFRILGKSNVLMLKAILDREKKSFEQIISSFYSLLSYPDALKKEYGLTLPDDALYDYAGFFLNTMGGRLYLFRRDSTSRMIVSYYAILLIEKAHIEGNDRHGIDLLPAVNSLIDEIENGGKHLQHREEYLDKLYDLKEKYEI